MRRLRICSAQAEQSKGNADTGASTVSGLVVFFVSPLPQVPFMSILHDDPPCFFTGLTSRTPCWYRLCLSSNVDQGHAHRPPLPTAQDNHLSYSVPSFGLDLGSSGTHGRRRNLVH
ncbi:hypothetical protein J3459_007910 [Metarhizium acridum]|nr:hypothetical protein J3459_007910 [Metarhizium acridum]